ncbi:coiled-coil domain-containing protein 157-like [Ylistrum balloti]|uniref:coiled-coil domain-containing protein 157-like n=1 Tax=Ylistrum balloti TaxID=509963 RepID=UPI002905B929|nr:coiled-coil domain-containing protein 157-like [Ylistrum balloti]
MAELLGNAAILESLKQDVSDLQWAIGEIVSRIGPVQHPSWKFPDKLSCDLDIEDLLDLYSYSDDTEECQVAHIALYELVIDRFVYLMQTLSAYNKQTMSRGGIDLTDTSSTSVGLVVKQYCNRQIQLQTMLQQTMSDIKTKNRKLEEIENNMKKMSDPLEDGSRTGSNMSLNSVGQLSNKSVTAMSAIYTARQFEEIARDANSKSCQTKETAFVPCEACHIAQKSFKTTGDLIVNMCKNQKLPSSLQQYRPLVAELKWLSSNDMARWAGEQNKDLNRINKNQDNILEVIANLKDEVETYEKKCKKLEKRVSNFDSEMRTEREVQSALRKQFDLKVKDMQHDHQETVAVITMQKNELASTKTDLEKQLQAYKADLERQQSLLTTLEDTRDRLMKDLEENKANAEDIQKLQSELIKIQSQFEKSSKELSRELAKNKSSSKHGKSLQTKQDMLLQRLDTLDQENEELKDQVGLAEEEREAAQESLEKALEQVTKLQTKIKGDEELIEHLSAEKEQLQESISQLETSIKTLEHQLEDAKERERLMIEYPDLNGPVNRDLQGTGDIVVDMENQVKANSQRITILEEQNEGLRNSITKILSIQRGPGGSPPKQAWVETTLKPVTLWNQQQLDKAQSEANNVWMPESSTAKEHTTSPMREQNGGHPEMKTQFNQQHSTVRKEHSKAKSPPLESKTKTPMEEFVVGRSSRPSSASRRGETPSTGSRSRPSSGKVMAPVNSSSISAYIQIRKAAKLGVSDLNTMTHSKGVSVRPPSGKISKATREITTAGSDTDYTKKDMFSCEKCDKMYSRMRDLEIHKSYCTG